MTATISAGASAVLELLEADELNECDESCFGSVLSEPQKGALLRLAIVANQLITDRCDLAFDWTAERGMDRVKAMARESK